MVTVEGIIGDLLLQHNCVIVPAFGGFVAQRVGAQLDMSHGTMTPPRKAILFNRQLINNDGLLVSSYAQQNKVDYAAAQSAVSNAIALWENDLKQGQRISIDRVGFLYVDQERNLCFEQDRFYNLLLESYGLGPIHFVSVSDVEAKTAHDAVQILVREALSEPVVEFQPEHIREIPVMASTETPVISITAAKRTIKPWKYVAAAALLPVAFYTFWIPMKTDVLESGMISLHDFNPFHSQQKGTYKPQQQVYKAPVSGNQHQLDNIPDGISIFSYAFDEDTYIPVRVAEPRTNATPVVSPEAPVVSAPAVQKPYSSSSSHIIVGCFSNAANAEKLASSLRAKGFDASVLPGDGLTRVSAGSGADFAKLNTKLQAEGLNGWILK